MMDWLNPLRQAKVASILILSVFCISSIAGLNTVTHEYPMSDEYFDRIYKLTGLPGSQEEYLHIHCKEKNMISVSITKDIEY